MNDEVRYIILTITALIYSGILSYLTIKLKKTMREKESLKTVHEGLEIDYNALRSSHTDLKLKNIDLAWQARSRTDRITQLEAEAVKNERHELASAQGELYALGEDIKQLQRTVQSMVYDLSTTETTLEVEEESEYDIESAIEDCVNKVVRAALADVAVVKYVPYPPNGMTSSDELHIHTISGGEAMSVNNGGHCSSCTSKKPEFSTPTARRVAGPDSIRP